MKEPVVYLLTNQHHNVLYVGVTADIGRRMMQHRSGRGSVFCQKYKVSKLVYLESHVSMIEAISREKAIKNWQRAWKDDLITTSNPQWADLFDQLNG